MIETHSTKRFSDRVEDYVRYRPSYPSSLLDFLRTQTGLGPGSTVADVGSGTGIFTRLLLATGAKVLALEPNADMRAAAEAASAGQSGFTSLTGRSDATGLPDHSVTHITCAQAFHWFDPVATRKEFLRILRPGGWCALIWNTARPEASDFDRGYEEIKASFGTDFKEIRHEKIPPALFTAFFGHAGWKKHCFPNAQVLDWPGLKGRLLSSSYAPKAGQPGHEPMLAALEALFARCQHDGRIEMKYDTELFLGQIQSGP